jgi:ubiquinone/menaquinone biosynthesis C-methylase UbiE
MATNCPVNFNIDYLRDQVRSTYDQVAQHPEDHYHFHRGADYAHDFLGYDRDELAALPKLSTDRFAGVGNPIAIGPIEHGATVLDHACGAGMDLLLAASRVGLQGHAIGVDMTPRMVECSRQAAREAGMSAWVEVHQGFYEELPVDDATVDIVLSNGVLNLAPDKHAVFNEMFRALKPGGKIYLADVVVQRELTEETRNNPDLWAACVAGALVESELTTLSESAGFVDGRVMQRFNCFYDTTAESKVAKDLFIQAVNFIAYKKG